MSDLIEGLVGPVKKCSARKCIVLVNLSEMVQNLFQEMRALPRASREGSLCVWVSGAGG